MEKTDMGRNLKGSKEVRRANLFFGCFG